MRHMRQREQATTPEGKAEAERALAELIRDNVTKNEMHVTRGDGSCFSVGSGLPRRNDGDR